MKKASVRIVAVIIVFILVLGLFSGVLAMFAGAAGPTITLSKKTFIQQGTSDNEIQDTTASFTFEISCVTSGFSDTGSAPTVKIKSFSNTFTPNTTGTVTQLSAGDYSAFKVTFTNMEIVNDSLAASFELEVTYPSGAAKTGTVKVSLYTPLKTSEDESSVTIISADTTVSKTLTVGEVTSGVTIKFNFVSDDGFVGTYGIDEFSLPASSSFSLSKSTTLTITEPSNSKGVDYYQATLKNVTYNGGGDKVLKLTLFGGTVFEVPLFSRHFDNDSSDGDTPPASDIVVESVIAKNAEGQRLVEIDKDTKPFSVEIVYYDVGLMREYSSDLGRAKLHAFMTNATGFKTLSGTAGTLELISTKTQFPRFRATFNNIESDGSANSLAFRVQYDMSKYDESIKGEGTAILFQVNKESSEDDEIAPLKPNVIVQAYSYGEESIVAGEECNLDITFCNTSKAVGVQNVVMTIEPGSGFAIAAASNTDYFPSMEPGATIPYAVALRALPAGNTAGAQTDYSVTVKFSYQYLSKKEYATGETSVKIAIPVVQLDRFSIDEITDYSLYLMPGEEGYVTVPITNKGKSLTYNITGSVKSASDADFIAPSVHFGNLDAGKSGTIDLAITINTPGEFRGEAIISYEDEDMRQKELTAPFSIMVNEPVPPDQIMPPDMDPGAMSPQGPGLLSLIFCGAGGLMVAAPIALYLIKRAKAKGSEDIDEDF